MTGRDRSRTEADYASRIGRVLVHIQQNLDAALPLEELAAVAHFSPFHFHRVFRGLVGESVMQHVRRLRLERAALRLRHTQQPINAIAFEAGYEAHESFTRAFRSAFGCSPSDFRGGNGLRTQLDSPSGTHCAGADGEVAFTPVTPVPAAPELDVAVRPLEPLHVAWLRHTGDYDAVGETWRELMDWAGANHVFGPDTRWFGACHDDPEVTPADKLRYDACVTVDGSVRGEGRIGVTTIPGGRFAVVLHEGPYVGLGETYARLFGHWFAQASHEPGDPPCLEFYLNEPDATPPEDLLTEIWVRIAG